MPIPWLTVLKIVPWSDVITNAPKVVEGAKKLWNNVSNKPPVQAPPVASPVPTPAPGTGAGSAAVALLQSRVEAAEAATAELHGQMLASSELIRTLADQNAQLIKHIEDFRMRMKWLTRATLAFGIVAVLGVVLALAR